MRLGDSLHFSNKSRDLLGGNFVNLGKDDHVDFLGVIKGFKDSFIFFVKESSGIKEDTDEFEDVRGTGVDIGLEDGVDSLFVVLVDLGIAKAWEVYNVHSVSNLSVCQFNGNIILILITDKNEFLVSSQESWTLEQQSSQAAYSPNCSSPR
eukprot:TRINITY_DN17684_c0_g1_i2.p2 TRINITY_DN17684_c0_g1~~TRINITY_DN17684_c0_g1_i2.p2  ORF type:complete len:151 (-),score=35.41 TRINITY_DN17684_c0_g1_i2:352-804(-)